MKIYLLSPSSVPMNPCLFPMFKKTFVEKGHEFVDTMDDCDIIFFDLHSRIADYSEMDIYWVLNGGLPIITFDEWDRGGMSSEVWPNPLIEQQRKIFEHMAKNKIKSVHFCRLLDKTQQYPLNLYPYEKPIIYEQQPYTEEQIFNREYDICFIANSAPQRERLKKVLEEDGRFRCNIILGATKIPFHNWIDEHRKAKMFVTWSAGGFTDERMHALFSVAAQLREDTNQLLLNDFTHLKNCIKLQSEPTEEDLDCLAIVVNDSKMLYQIYTNAIRHVKEFYSEAYMANHVINTIKQHLNVK